MVINFIPPDTAHTVIFFRYRNMTTTASENIPPCGPDQHYRQALDKGLFQIQRCNACTHAVFYPRMICPHCGSPELQWESPSGRGTVYSTTVVRRKADAGGDYNVALIDLEEGVRMMSRVEGIAAHAVRIGMAVQAQVRQHQNQGLVVFVAQETA